MCRTDECLNKAVNFRNGKIDCSTVALGEPNVLPGDALEPSGEGESFHFSSTPLPRPGNVSDGLRNNNFNFVVFFTHVARKEKNSSD